VLEVHRRQHADCYRRQREHNRKDAGLGGIFHKIRYYTSTLVTKRINSLNASFKNRAALISTENHNLFRNSHYDDSDIVRFIVLPSSCQNFVIFCFFTGLFVLRIGILWQNG
jgi:hypothetical protein